jgi:hypothetical protein
MKSFNTLIDNGVVQFQFNNINEMTRYIDPISMFVEGSTKDKRIGHNFSVDNFYKYISSMSVKMHTNETLEILFIVKKHDIKYIIAYVAGDIQTKKHELQHAKFYIDEKYRQSIYDKWTDMDKKTQNYIVSFLKKLGYSDEVIIDEFQAYYMTEKDNFFGIKIK